MTLPHVRRQSRQSSEIFVDYLGTDCLGNGRLLHVSPVGAHVRGSDVPVVGTTLSLRLVAQNDAQPLYVERAVVRWRHGWEFGLEVVTLTPQAQGRWIRLAQDARHQRGCHCVVAWPWLCRCRWTG